MEREIVLISKRLLNKNKNRVTITIRIDKDLLEILRTKQLNISDTINIALARWLDEKDYL
jgi:post-segregation antitoxin (ccd killing protein)